MVENKIISPTAQIVLPKSEKLNIRWQTSVQNVTVTLFIQQYMPNGQVKSWKLGEDHKNSKAFSTLLPSVVQPCARNSIRLDIHTKYGLASKFDRIDSIHSEEFAITPPKPSVNIGNILGSTQDSSTFQKLVPGRLHRFRWSFAGDLGIVTLELWSCDTVPLGALPTFALEIDRINTTIFHTP